MRRELLALVAFLVVGCSSGAAGTSTPADAFDTDTPTPAATEPPTTGAATVAPSKAPESSPAGNVITVTGDAGTGVSSVFELADGSYEVAWTTTADTAGCYFTLVLTTEANGPSVMNGVKLLPEAKAYSGSFLWLLVRGGKYVLQEDRTGFGHCAGPWSATVTLK